jgi:hypothetical protein
MGKSSGSSPKQLQNLHLLDIASSSRPSFSVHSRFNPVGSPYIYNEFAICSSVVSFTSTVKITLKHIMVKYLVCKCTLNKDDKAKRAYKQSHFEDAYEITRFV